MFRTAGFRLRVSGLGLLKVAADSADRYYLR